MNVERKLQINLAIMVAAGATLFGVAQSNIVLPTMGVAAACLALIFTDIRQSFRLNRTVANVVALAAAAVVLIDFFAANNRSQLLAIANLLICLQIVLMFQEKTSRTYGHLAVLSLLQVVVSASLRVGLEFGLLLLLYMASAVSFLALLFNYRTERRVKPVPPKAATDAKTPPQPHREAVSATPLSVLFGEPPCAQFLYREEEFSQQLTGWRLPRQLLALCVGTMMFSVVLFLTLPRTRNGVQLPFDNEPRIGMPGGEVSLDEMTDILTNDELVMRLEFIDPESGENVAVFGDLYLRGAVLENYAVDRSGRHIWTAAESAESGVIGALAAQRGYPGLVQRIVLQPMEGETLFAIYPAYRLSGEPSSAAYNYGAKQLVKRMDEAMGPTRPIRYEVFTTSIQNGLQRNVMPHELGTMQRFRNTGQGLSRESSLLRLANETDRLSYVDREQFPHICKLADEIVAKVKEVDPGAGPDQIARALQNHFLYEDYTYTLDFSKVKRTPGMDPIEDFVANNHMGHCEYFASALVIALRSQNIPARMVVGYHNGEYNSIGKFYEVRQNHTHAWVEMYLESEQVGESQMPPEGAPFGAWMRLDPTPGAEEGRAWEDRSALLTKFNEVYGFARLMWMDYVVNLNSQRQNDAIFEPLAGSNSAARSLFAPGEQRPDQEGSQPGKGPDIATIGRTLLVGVILIVVLAVGFRAVRRLRLVWRRKEKASQAADRLARRGPPVPFYERLRELLARYDLRRAAAQTPAEFAVAVGGRLAATPGLHDFAAIPQHVVDAFYDVRFGRRTLSKEELADVETALDQLDAALVRAESTTPHHSPPHGSDNGRLSNTAS